MGGGEGLKRFVEEGLGMVVLVFLTRRALVLSFARGGHPPPFLIHQSFVCLLFSLFHRPVPHSFYYNISFIFVRFMIHVIITCLFCSSLFTCSFSP